MDVFVYVKLGNCEECYQRPLRVQDCYVATDNCTSLGKQQKIDAVFINLHDVAVRYRPV